MIGRLYFFVYRIVSYLLLPVVLVRFLVRSMTRREYGPRLSERFGHIPSNIRTGSIWIHAVSVGEVNAVRPLVELLLETNNAPLLLSCVTATGSAQIKRLFGDRVSHIYAPIDAGFIVKRTLQKVRPRAVIIAETELWPNFLYASRAKNIPVAFVNLRISDSTFRKAQRFLPLCRFVLGNINTFCVQTQNDADRIVALGAVRETVQVTGNLKFDVSPPKDVHQKAAELRNQWGQERLTIVLGSSHDGEEDHFMQMLAELRPQFPGILALIAPRHPERFDQVYQKIAEFGLSVMRRSQWKDEEPIAADVILIDSMGELVEFYAAADVAVVGGSFVASGGHNVLEPLSVGTPAVFGSDMSNFREISRLVVECNAGEMVKDFGELKDVLIQHLGDLDLRDLRVRNSSQLFTNNSGALERTMERLEKLPV